MIIVFILKRFKKGIRSELAVVERLDRKKEYSKIVDLYRNKAKRSKNSKFEANYLGIAELWEHYPDEALSHFLSTKSGLTSKEEDVLINNSALAYLQKGYMTYAYDILEKIKPNGTVLITTYALALLGTCRLAKAKVFVEQNPVGCASEEKMLNILLAFDPEKEETLKPIEALIKAKENWLHLPIIEHIYSKFQLEVFFAKLNRYPILEQEANELLQEIDSNGDLFSDAKLRYLRKLISVLVKRMSPEGISTMFGFPSDLDLLIKESFADDELKDKYLQFIKRVDFAFWRTIDFEAYNPEQEYEFAKECMPIDTVSLLGNYTNMFDIFCSESTNIGFRMNWLEVRGHFIRYFEYLSGKTYSELKSQIEAIVNILHDFEGQQKLILEVARVLTVQLGDLKYPEVRECLIQMPENLQKRFIETFQVLNI